MRGVIRLISILGFISLVGTGSVQAQTERTGLVPYISMSEFESVSVGRPAGENAASTKDVGKEFPFREIETISSLDSLTHLLGEPNEFKRLTYPSGETVRGHLEYEGLYLEYLKTSNSSRFRLREMKMQTSGWHLTINGRQVEPGMPISRLSPEVRQSIIEAAPSSDFDAEATIRIAKPEKDKNGETQFMGESTFFGIQVNRDTETVELVRFHRLI